MITALDEKTALVLIDLQHGILQSDTAHDKKGVLQQAGILTEAFQAARKPVIFVTVVPDGAWTHLRTEVSARPARLPENFADLHPDFHPGDNDVLIRKHQWTAFFKTPLHSDLQQRGITQIVLGGVSTSIGVEGTARDAAVLGYNIAFAEDAMTDRTLESHAHSVQRIFPRLGEVGLTEDILEFL